MSCPFAVPTRRFRSEEEVGHADTHTQTHSDTHTHTYGRAKKKRNKQNTITCLFRGRGRSSIDGRRDAGRPADVDRRPFRLQAGQHGVGVGQAAHVRLEQDGLAASVFHLQGEKKTDTCHWSRFLVEQD